MQISEAINTEIGPERVATQDFIYSPTNMIVTSIQRVGVVQRATKGIWAKSYFLYIAEDTTITCGLQKNASVVQKQLCNEVNKNSTL